MTTSGRKAAQARFRRAARPRALLKWTWSSWTGDRSASATCWRLDIAPVLRMRPMPLRDPRFVADGHLGKLARPLRMAGFDTLWSAAWDDDEIVRLFGRAAAHDPRARQGDVAPARRGARLLRAGGGERDAAQRGGAGAAARGKARRSLTAANATCSWKRRRPRRSPIAWLRGCARSTAASSVALLASAPIGKEGTSSACGGCSSGWGAMI